MGACVLVIGLAGVWFGVAGRATNQTIVPLAGRSTSTKETPFAEWPDARQFAVQQGDVRVQVESLGGGYEGDCHIKLRITNVGTKRRIEHAGWGGIHEPQLTDNLGNIYHALTRKPAEVAMLDPNESVSETLEFDRLMKDVEYLRLELPASAFSGEGQLRLEISNTMLLLELGASMGQAAVPGLCRLLKDPEWQVRAGGFGLGSDDPANARRGPEPGRSSQRHRGASAAGCLHVAG